MNYSIYHNESEKLKDEVIRYCIERGYEAQETRNVLNVVSSIDILSYTDLSIRERFYAWMSHEPNHSTIQLRDICKEAGFDFWNGTEDANLIDDLDSIHAKNQTK